MTLECSWSLCNKKGGVTDFYWPYANLSYATIQLGAIFDG